jgi:hypothetical protein
MYSFLNYFFFTFHTVLTLFNMFGWVWKPARKWNLVTLLLTAGSWFILGIWHGWGYCVCTEWHWQVREELGYHDQSRSYIHFLVYKLTGFNLDQQLVESLTLWGFIIALVISLWLNIRDFRRKNNHAKSNNLLN